MTAATPNALAPWLGRQLSALLGVRAHAVLLRGPSGMGQSELAFALAQAWLCDAPSTQGACGQCPSCHAIAVKAHPDLRVLLPETEAIAQGWPLDEAAQRDIDDKKRKPSREIRIEALRDAIEFAQRTSGRGRGQVVLIYPADRMNTVTANALLKTLEEPPGPTRFVLAADAADRLPATVRSRCHGHTLAWPAADEALAWLKTRGLDDTTAQALWRQSGGRPMATFAQGVQADALQAWLREWQALPAAVLGPGDGAGAGTAPSVAQVVDTTLKGWAAPALLDALLKLCHDLMALAAGGAPRFFADADLRATQLGRPLSLAALAAWHKALLQHARHAEHPFAAGLMAEALVTQARVHLNSSTR
jgi:DNA polymerase III subunit delta'